MTMGFIWGFIKLLFTMGIILVGFFYLNKMLRKAEKSRRSENGMIQIIDRMRIGMKDEVILCKIGEEYMLYPTSSGTITLLTQKQIKPYTEDFQEYFESQNPKQLFNNVMDKVNDRLVKK